MQYFTSNYEKVKRSARQRKNRQFKQKQRRKEREIDEEAQKRAMAEERKKDREIFQMRKLMNVLAEGTTSVQ